MTTQEMIPLAIQHHQAGRLGDAEAPARQILLQQPDHPDVLHLMGVIAHKTGRRDQAATLIGKAIAIRPGVAPYHSDLGTVLAEGGHFAEAIPHFQRAAELQPNNPDAAANLLRVVLAHGYALYANA